MDDKDALYHMILESKWGLAMTILVKMANNGELTDKCQAEVCECLVADDAPNAEIAQDTLKACKYIREYDNVGLAKWIALHELYKPCIEAAVLMVYIARTRNETALKDCRALLEINLEQFMK